MELYDRQKTLNLSIPESLTIVGCGGVGYYVSKFAAMSGVKKLYLFDPDIIEETNLNRLDLSMEDIGKNKAVIVRELIEKLRPDCYVYGIPFIFQEHLYFESDYIIDCTDKHKTQIEIENIAKKLNTVYIKAGYDGNHITVANSVKNVWSASEEEGYTVTPSWVVPTVVVAAMTVAKIMLHNPGEISLNLVDIFNLI